jgi:pyruvate formate lyase activating enzyme
MSPMPLGNNAVGSVLRIERSSIHDGQGLRTVVFLKGCPLSCAWCSTPESRHAEPERGFDENLCSACGECVKHCPSGALSLAKNGLRVEQDPSKCRLCFNCFQVCPNKAVKKYGALLSVEEVVREINKDEIFFFHSGGGVTLSGGEPLSQAEFTSAILEQCKKNGIHTAVESSFHVEFPNIEIVLPWLDLLYVDIKHMDGNMHELLIGEKNMLILDNLCKINLSAFPLEVIIRIPLIPGFNDSDKNLSATLAFCKNIKKIKEIELLAYHRLGIDTYRHLGQEYLCRDLTPQTREQLLERVNYLDKQNSGIPIKVGSGFI